MVVVLPTPKTCNDIGRDFIENLFFHEIKKD
jgi:hypothetical protein